MVAALDLVYYDTLLQNATAILLQNVTKNYYKIRQLFYCKMWQFITKCNSYYKIWRLFQNVSVQTISYRAAPVAASSMNFSMP